MADDEQSNEVEKLKQEKSVLEKDKLSLEKEVKKITALLSKSKEKNALQQLMDDNAKLKIEIDLLNEHKSQNQALKDQMHQLAASSDEIRKSLESQLSAALKALEPPNAENNGVTGLAAMKKHYESEKKTLTLKLENLERSFQELSADKAKLVEELNNNRASQVKSSDNPKTMDIPVSQSNAPQTNATPAASTAIVAGQAMWSKFMKSATATTVKSTTPANQNPSGEAISDFAKNIKTSGSLEDFHVESEKLKATIKELTIELESTKKELSTIKTDKSKLAEADPKADWEKEKQDLNNTIFKLKLKLSELENVKTENQKQPANEEKLMNYAETELDFKVKQLEKMKNESDSEIQKLTEQIALSVSQTKKLEIEKKEIVEKLLELEAKFSEESTQKSQLTRKIMQMESIITKINLEKSQLTSQLPDPNIWEQEKSLLLEKVNSLQESLRDESYKNEHLKSEISQLKSEILSTKKLHESITQNLKFQLQSEAITRKNLEQQVRSATGSEPPPNLELLEIEVRNKVKLEHEELLLLEKQRVEEDMKQKIAELVEKLKDEKNDLNCTFETEIAYLKEKNIAECDELRKQLSLIQEEYHQKLLQDQCEVNDARLKINTLTEEKLSLIQTTETLKQELRELRIQEQKMKLEYEVNHAEELKELEARLQRENKVASEAHMKLVADLEQKYQSEMENKLNSAISLFEQNLNRKKTEENEKLLKKIQELEELLKKEKSKFNELINQEKLLWEERSKKEKFELEERYKKEKLEIENYQKKEKQEFEERIKSEKSKLNTDIEKLRKDISIIEQQKNEQKKSLEKELMGKVDESAKALSKLKNLEQEILITKTEKGKVMEQLLDFNKKLAEFQTANILLQKQIDEKEAQYASRIEELNSANLKNSEFQSKFETTNAEYEVLRKSLERATKSNADKDDANKKLKSRVDELLQSESQQKKIVSKLERERDELQKSSQALLISVRQLEQTISDNSKELLETRELEASRGKEYEELKAQIVSLLKKTADLENDNKIAERKSAQIIRDLQKQLARERKQKETLSPEDNHEFALGLDQSKESGRHSRVVLPVSQSQELVGVPKVERLTGDLLQLAQGNEQLNRKCKLLEEEIRILNERMTKTTEALEHKSKVLQQYVLRDYAAKLQPDEKGVKFNMNIFSSVGAMQKMDPVLLSEINMKMQKLLEELTTKMMGMEEEIKRLKIN